MLLTPQQRLAEAQTALHALLTGTSVVEVRDSTGESVRFTQVNSARLQAYIRDLQAEIAGLSPAVRPMRPIFGSRL